MENEGYVRERGVMAGPTVPAGRIPQTPEEWDAILDPQERQFAAEYFSNGGNMTGAALALDPDDPDPQRTGYDMLHRRRMIMFMQFALYANGVTPYSIAQTVRGAMVGARIRKLSKDGDIVDMGEDHKTRLQAAQMGARMLGAEEVPSPKEYADTAINISLTGEGGPTATQYRVTVIREGGGSLSGKGDPFLPPIDVTPED